MCPSDSGDCRRNGGTGNPSFFKAARAKSGQIAGPVIIMGLFCAIDADCLTCLIDLAQPFPSAPTRTKRDDSQLSECPSSLQTASFAPPPTDATPPARRAARSARVVSAPFVGQRRGAL